MGVSLYPSIIHEGDLSPDSFGDEIDNACNAIYKACKGFGTDEKELIQTLGTKTPEERYKISLRYKEIYDKELKKLMKSEVSGDMGVALYFLGVSPDEAEVEMIKKACKGIGTKKVALYPIIIGRTNEEMNILKKKYFDVETKDLGRKLDSELGGDFEKLIFNCLQASEEEYDESYHNDDLVKQDVNDLYDAGQGKFGTDEAGMFKIICARPTEHLQKVNLAYAEKHGYTLLKAVEKELGGKVEDACIFMLEMKLKPYEAVAHLIDKACKGFGTNELLLTMTLIRYQLILKEVNNAHIELYGQSIRDRVKDETGGKYESLLLAIIDTVV